MAKHKVHKDKKKNKKLKEVAATVATQTSLAKVFTKVQKAEYVPDEEFIASDQLHPTLESFDFEKTPEGQPLLIEGSVYVTNGSQYMLVRFDGVDELKKLREAADKRFSTIRQTLAAPWRLREATVVDLELESEASRIYTYGMRLLSEGYNVDDAKKKLIEDFTTGGSGGSFNQDWFAASIDPRGIYGSGYDPMAEFIPIMGGPWQKQLYLQQYLLQHAQAFEAYNHNPIAKQLIDLTTAFVFGRGVDFTCTNVELDEVLREFCDRTALFTELETVCTETWWSGNLFLEWYDDTPDKGLTDFRSQDPSTIWEIVTDPEDFKKVYYYHQQYSTPYQNLYSGANVKDTAPKDIPVMKYIMRHIPAAQVLHRKLNCSSWEKYGRSDIFCVLGWLKRLKDLLNARVVKGLLEAAFVWDFELATDQGDVNQAGIQLPDPFSPGSSFVHNKTITLKPQTATMTHGGDTMPDVSELKAIIATGVGTPKEFIGETARMSKTASLTTTEPGTKRYERRQRWVEDLILMIFDRVIKNAYEAGTLALEEILQEARSVKRLADKDSMQTRADVVDDIEELRSENANLATKNQAAANQDPLGVAPQVPQQNKKLAVSSATREAREKILGNLLEVKVITQAAYDQLMEAFSGVTPNEKQVLNDKQKRRIKTIIKTGKFAKELVEITFPSIAAEDRSAKLKDLALAEAMEWLPKSISATMAAKELNITTYDFPTIWAMIVEEAKQGMSLAHVFGQDGKHVPAVVQAQSIEEETQALEPQAQQFQNTPTPPAVAGMKLTPKQPGGGNGVPPGSTPNSGDTKINNKLATPPLDPTSRSPGRSPAANHPMTAEGRDKIKGREVSAVKVAIYATLLREAVQPMTTVTTALARYILSNGNAVAELEKELQALEAAEV